MSESTAPVYSETSSTKKRRINPALAGKEYVPVRFDAPSKMPAMKQFEPSAALKNVIKTMFFTVDVWRGMNPGLLPSVIYNAKRIAAQRAEAPPPSMDTATDEECAAYINSVGWWAAADVEGRASRTSLLHPFASSLLLDVSFKCANPECAYHETPHENVSAIMFFAKHLGCTSISKEINMDKMARSPCYHPGWVPNTIKEGMRQHFKKCSALGSVLAQFWQLDANLVSP